MIALNDPVKALLLDIEGTTTPIAFVYQVLFPYARQHMKDYLARHLSDDEVQAALINLCAEQQADAARNLNPPAINDDSPDTLLETATTYLHWLMDQDRKSTPLKSLQGKIWKAGYRTGALKSELFEDVPRALERWRRQQRQVCIYSSGSVLAQRLLFGHTQAGDLTSLIAAYFDTGVGAKREAASYQRITEALQLQPAEIAFISDITAELDAARAAGLQTLLAVRPGNAAQPQAHLYLQLQTFDSVFP